MNFTKYIILVLLCAIPPLFAQADKNNMEGIPWIKRSFPAGHSEKFTFAILGDKTGGGEENWPVFDRAVDEINRLRPDFVVMVGDLIQGYVTDLKVVEDMWREFFEHAERLEVPLLMLPGNHDISNETMYDYWRENFGKSYYSLLYNNNLFLLLNTEENQKSKDGQLGKMQLEFIRQQIEKNKNADHIFLFMHKPVWAMQGPGKGEWQEVASLLIDRKATIVAGHWHNLLYESIDGHRYIVHSATGGRLSPKAVDEFGYFFHYSLVTVNPDTAVVAIIKPGNILEEDIATAGFANRINDIVSVNTYLDPDLLKSRATAEASFKMFNPLDEIIQLHLGISSDKNSGWIFNQSQIVVDLPPGISRKFNFTGTCNYEKIGRLPNVQYAVKYRSESIIDARLPLIPGDKTDYRYPDEVMVVGPFDLGTKERPYADARVSVPRLFESLEPEKQPSLSKSYATIFGNKKWEKIKIRNGKINFDKIFGEQDFAIGFVQFSIVSPQDMKVFAGVKPDNFCKVFLNGDVVLDGHPLRGVQKNPDVFVLSLMKGENILLMKTADYPGNWYVDFWIADPHKKLTFK